MPLSPHGVLLSATAVVAVLVGVAPVPATATPDPGPAGGEPFVWADPPPPPSVTSGTGASSQRPSQGPSQGPWRADLRATRDAARATNALTLHSLPGSQHVIFLDFDGHVVSGTMWNDQGVPTTRSPGWDPSGNGAAALSATEAAYITEIWARVAEDYAPFDVDVTTADPGQAAITRTDGSDPTYGVRVLVTDDPTARAAINTCAGTCGGVASDDVFDITTDHARYQPAWVFPQALSDDPKWIAEAVSHEVGHIFGLSHDDRSGDSQAGYYAGHAGWAPIMGVGYTQPVTQWSRGDFAGSLNTEDDLAVIAANGAPLRPDEDGTLPAPGATAYISGASDTDVYQLTGCAGAVSIRSDVAPVGPNLDVELRLLDLSSVLQAANDPLSAVSSTNSRVATGLDAAIAWTAPDTPVDYLLVVDGTGRDGSNPTTGYDDYGSVGAYRLTVSGCGIADGAPGPPGVPSVGFRGTTAVLAWTAPTTAGDSPVTSYDVLVDGVVRTTVTGLSATVPGLVRGRTYQLAVAAVNAQGAGLVAARNATVPIVKPGAPRIGKATSGTKGGTITAGVAWTAPTDNGGSALTQYRVTCYRLDKRGRVVETTVTGALSAAYSRVTVQLAKAGSYRFAVSARNAVGWGPVSGRSSRVTAR